MFLNLKSMGTAHMNWDGRRHLKKLHSMVQYFTEINSYRLTPSRGRSTENTAIESVVGKVVDLKTGQFTMGQACYQRGNLNIFTEPAPRPERSISRNVGVSFGPYVLLQKTFCDFFLLSAHNRLIGLQYAVFFSP